MGSEIGARGGGRNYGVDLLRLVSMCFVVILHTLGQGGVLAAAPEGSAVYLSGWYLEALSFCAVDIFALISGYVGFSAEPRPTKLSSWILLWLQVVFYGVALTLAFHFLRPDTVALKDLRGMYFPVKNDLYWYFTAYTGLFAVKPLLDAGLRSVGEQTARRVFLAVFLVFSAFDLFFPHFKLASGYCFAWIALLYVMGGAMRKCGIGKNLRPAAALGGIVILSLLTWAWKVFGKLLPKALGRIDMVSYVSPTVLAAAILFLLCFARLRPGKALRAVIGFAAPGAFAVYLINTNRFVWTLVMKERFAPLAEKPAAAMICAVLGFALAFTAVSVGIDALRQALVRLLRIRKLAEAADRVVTRCVDWAAREL